MFLQICLQVGWRHGAAKGSTRVVQAISQADTNRQDLRLDSLRPNRLPQWATPILSSQRRNQPWDCHIPNHISTRYRKVDLFELLSSNPPLTQDKLGGVTFYELKFTDEDEFSHWSSSDIPTARKKRELENFHLVKTNNIHSSKFQKLLATFLEDQIRWKH